jgi:hypothetical protein
MKDPEFNVIDLILAIHEEGGAGPDLGPLSNEERFEAIFGKPVPIDPEQMRRLQKLVEGVEPLTDDDDLPDDFIL